MNRSPIVCAAIRFRGLVYSLPAPNRHHNIMWMLAEIMDIDGIDAYDEDQGFIDSDGRYLTRKQAYVSAELNGQIKNGKLIGSVLTSEDLW